jgi:hypothetical protein
LNKLLLVTCSLLGVLAIKDLGVAISTDATFDTADGININFEAGYYVFGVAIGLLASLSENFKDRILGTITGFLCLSVSVYSLLDLREDTIGKVEDCVILQSDKVAECINKLKISP